MTSAAADPSDLGGVAGRGDRHDGHPDSVRLASLHSIRSQAEPVEQRGSGVAPPFKFGEWRMLAERAPDSATADYLHEVFEPTARAIAGLEKALEGFGLLEEALSLDLRRPRDYFGRVWSTTFRARELAELDTEGEAA
ncbi:hypothetical protein ABZS86_34100 [Streptomyces sp. NPDC005355]|uniref:hypothetical protein n=1 Tax=Streptomyces sp. NPDC005355 TaxID=3157038 RepID=UPI0033A24432